MTLSDFARRYFDELRACIDAVDLCELEAVSAQLTRALEEDRTVWVVGNGGSAAAAMHLASDLCRSQSGTGRRGLRAVSLTDNVAAFSASANDSSYEDAFAELVALQVREGDLVLVLSGSGNSENVLRAVKVAREKGAVTVGLVGFGGGALGEAADLKVSVDSRHYGAVEDLHLALGHILSMHLAGARRIENPDRRPPSSL